MEKKLIKSHKDLEVYQLSFELALWTCPLNRRSKTSG